MRVQAVDRQPQRLGTPKRHVEVRLGQHHRELLAAEPARDVAAAERAPEQFGERLQQQVAGRVPGCVVHALEEVHVEQQQGDRPIGVPARVVALAAERIVQEAAVVQAGQRILQRLDLERLPQPQVGQPGADLFDRGQQSCCARRRGLGAVGAA